MILDVLVCGYEPGLNQDIYGAATKNYQDARHIKQQYNNLNAMQAELDAFPDVNLRYYFQEYNLGCGPYSELDFNNSTTWCLQEAGRREAQNMLGVGQDDVKRTLGDWLKSKDLKKEFPYFRSYLKALLGI